MRSGELEREGHEFRLEVLFCTLLRVAPFLCDSRGPIQHLTFAV